MSPRARRWLATGTGAILVLTGCTTAGDGEPVKPAPVALAAPGAPGPLSIGVIVSLTSLPGEGAEWSRAAEGAQVAAYRYRLGGADVTIKAADDKGDDAGATAAVEQLVQAGVTGIVAATSGSHVQAIVSAAAASGTPVILPYEAAVDVSGAAWSTAPSPSTVATALQRAAESVGSSAPLVVDAGAGVPDGFTGEPVRVDPQDDEAAIAGELKARLKDENPDGLLVTGPAGLQARVVRAAQGESVSLPIVLGPEATSPAFAAGLAANGGSLSGNFATVGVDAGDSAAMQPTSAGQAMSAFLAGLRATAADADVKDLFDGDAFSTVAPLADARSHDAVVALVAASAKAGSAQPAEVAKALTGLTLSHEQGLAGPPLTFGSPLALAEDAVVPLRASAKGTGLRPESDAGQLYWFRAPAG